MSWNASNVKSNPPQKKTTNKLSLSGVTPYIGLVLVLGAISYAVFALLLREHMVLKESNEADQTRAIAEVSPEIAERPVDHPSEPPKKVPYWQVDESQTNGFSEAMIRKWKNERRPRTEPIPIDRPKARFAIFNHRSENLIASYMCAELGQSAIGTPNLKGITQDFLKSCTEPIVVSKDDDDYTAALKRDMTAMKIEIKSRIDAGEDLEQILLDTHKELQQLANYKQMLQSELHKVENEGSSAEDIEDFLAAANSLLEKKGIAPIKAGPITRRKLLELQNQKGN